MRSVPNPEHERIVKAVIQWLQLRGANDPRCSADWLLTLEVDADHSALLARLVSGKPALPKAPPTAYSYPNYALVENGWDTTSESGVWFDHSQPRVSVDQTMWRILETLPDGAYIVQSEEAPWLACQLSRCMLDYPSIGDDAVDGKVSLPSWRLDVLAADTTPIATGKDA